MRASVTVEGTGGEWIVAFTHSDRELLDAMKEAVSPRPRWDVGRKHWRVIASTQVMTDLCARFEQFGASVTRPDSLTQHSPVGGDRNSAEYWEKQFHIMDHAARQLHEQIRQLIDERDDLEKRLKAAAHKATAASGWAEKLFDAVGPTLRKPVFKALTTCLHPDRAGAEGHTLQQQLNAAYDKKRR
ncbi:hypothetical protein [Nocardia brasiliensis]|uniref:hypothetical protein n=1 Tax=Nocardia brasiliensis TaxID=37326 RepID=UPI00245831BA|nr:hypothetical protein [Nocardia brasiliensis]